MQCIECIPHVFPFIERWFCVIVNVTLQFARAAAVLELIGQFFLQLHLLKFYVVLALLRFDVLPFVATLCQIKHDF